MDPLCRGHQDLLASSPIALLFYTLSTLSNLDYKTEKEDILGGCGQRSGEVNAMDSDDCLGTLVWTVSLE